MIPGGYIAGMDRSNEGSRIVTHLYKGNFNDPGLPMCVRGWNRASGMEYSIFRGNISDAGICRICLRRALAGRDGVEARERKTRWI